MQFKDGAKPYSYEVEREGGEDIVYINYMGAPYVPSLSDYPEVMERTIDVLMENPHVSRVVYVQQKNYNYDFNETAMLLEIAQLYVYLVKQERVLSREKLAITYEQFFGERYNKVFSFLFLLKSDPISAYSELKKIIIEEKIFLDKVQARYKTDQANFFKFFRKDFVII